MNDKNWEEERARWKEEAVEIISTVFLDGQQIGVTPESLVLEARRRVDQILQASDELVFMEEDWEREH